MSKGLVQMSTAGWLQGLSLHRCTTTWPNTDTNTKDITNTNTGNCTDTNTDGLLQRPSLQ